MTAGTCYSPPLYFNIPSRTTTSVLRSSTSSSLCALSLSWRYCWRIGGNKFAAISNLTDEDCGRRNWRIYASRKNVTSRKIQQSKGRMSEKPSKLGMVGAPVEINPLIQGNNLTGESLLNEDQAIGQVITAQANFMRVIVERDGKSDLVTSVDDAKTRAERDGRVGSPELEIRGDSESDHARGEDLQTSSDKSEFLKPPRQRLELLCVVRGLLKKIKRRVLVGDRVLVSGIDWTERRGMIEDVLDRTSEIVDPPVANVNNLLVVFSIDQPQIDEKVLSRFLVEAESTEIDFTLVLNKVDLVQPEVVESWQAKLANWGYRPVLCSADLKIGLSDLSSLVKNKVTVIIGPSGVGKSSLINGLRDQKVLPLLYDTNEVLQATVFMDAVDRTHVPEHQLFDASEGFEELRVGEVSVLSGRGRHTTRHVRLLGIPGGVGLLADTPGFSQPSLGKVASSTLAEHFPEARKRLAGSEGGNCGFPNCMHLGEPNCAVGDEWERYSHYIDLLDEIRTRERVQKKVLGTKRESDMRIKKMGAEGVKKTEPRLALNRHRRESRKQVNQSLEEIFREEEELQADMKEDTEKEVRSMCSNGDNDSPSTLCEIFPWEVRVRCTAIVMVRVHDPTKQYNKLLQFVDLVWDGTFGQENQFKDATLCNVGA